MDTKEKIKKKEITSLRKVTRKKLREIIRALHTKAVLTEEHKQVIELTLKHEGRL